MSTFLVTGAGGFIGSSLSKKLLENPLNKVITIDNFKTGFKRNIPKGVVLIEGDCSSEEIILKLNKYRFDCIFHIAGQSSGEISFDDPVYDLNTNTKSTLLLLQFAKKIIVKNLFLHQLCQFMEIIKKSVLERSINLIQNRSMQSVK